MNIIGSPSQQPVFTQLSPTLPLSSQNQTSQIAMDRLADNMVCNAKNIPTTERARFNEAINTARDLADACRIRLQVTNALTLESLIEPAASLLRMNGIDDSLIKQSREQIENAMDALVDISLVDQLNTLDASSNEANVIKDTIVKQLKSRLKTTNDDVKTLKLEFEEIIKNTPPCQFHKEIGTFIQEKVDALIILQVIHRSTNFWTGIETVTRVDHLNSKNVKKYAEEVEGFIKDFQQESERKTSIKRITQLLKTYRELDEGIQNLLPTLHQSRNFVALHILDSAQKFHKESITDIAAKLTSAAQMKLYANTLENAIQGLAKAAIEATKTPTNSFEQLIYLNKLQSSYAPALQKLLQDTYKAKIDAYIARLSHYSELITGLIALYEEQNSPKAADFKPLAANIEQKIHAAEEKKVSFTTRLYFWQFSPQTIKVEDLPADKFLKYLEMIDKTINEGLAELDSSAERAGFTWS